MQGQLYVRGDGSLGYWWLANEGYETKGTPKEFRPDIANKGDDGLYKSGYYNSYKNDRTNKFKPQMPIKQIFSVCMKRGAGAIIQKTLNDAGDISKFLGDHKLDGQLDNVMEGKKILNDELAGALCSEIITLTPQESKTITFILAWSFPNRYQDVTLHYPSFGNGHTDKDKTGPGYETDLSLEYSEINEKHNTNYTIQKSLPADIMRGNMYNEWNHDNNSEPDNSLTITKYVVKEFDHLVNTTKSFHDAYYEKTTLPYWFIHRIAMPVSILATATCQWWAPKINEAGNKNVGKFWAWEGVGSCYGTCGHVWNYTQAMGRLFPSLARNIREKQDFNPDAGFDNVTGGIYFRGDQTHDDLGEIVKELPTTAGDAQGGYILDAYREHLMSPNNDFLESNWIKIKQALQYLINLDNE